MSHISPVAPPPPPPPAPLMKVTSDTPVAAKERPVVVSIPSDECSWAWEFPEVQKGCYLSRVCQYAPPKHCQYYSVPSILQVGPTCGLTALSMLLGGKPTAAQLLENAIAQEFTINGELFSAQYLFELTRKHLPGPGSCQLHQGQLSCKKVKELLKAGGCLLVPYPFSKVIYRLKFKPSLSSGFPHFKPRLRLTVRVERLTARCYQPVLLKSRMFSVKNIKQQPTEFCKILQY